VGDDVASGCNVTVSTVERALSLTIRYIAVLQRDHILVHDGDFSRHSFADAIRGGNSRTGMV